MAHGYETGRLNLPFVGISTFGKYPYVEDWDAIDADIAVLGAPFDAGTQFRAGARFGPRAIREASTLFSFGHSGAYDHEDDVTYLAAETKTDDRPTDLKKVLEGVDPVIEDGKPLEGEAARELLRRDEAKFHELMDKGLIKGV